MADSRYFHLIHGRNPDHDPQFRFRRGVLRRPPLRQGLFRAGSGSGRARHGGDRFRACPVRSGETAVRGYPRSLPHRAGVSLCRPVSRVCLPARFLCGRTALETGYLRAVHDGLRRGERADPALRSRAGTLRLAQQDPSCGRKRRCGLPRGGQCLSRPRFRLSAGRARDQRRIAGDRPPRKGSRRTALHAPRRGRPARRKRPGPDPSGHAAGIR